MTVQTPFPERPATPYWGPDPRDPRMFHPEGEKAYGLGDTATDVLNAITAGAVAADRSLVGGQQMFTCPTGYVMNPTLGICQPGVSGSVTASGSSGLLILAAIGLGIFFMSRR